MAVLPMRRRLTVDMEGLETAFQAEPDMEMRNYLDVRTGEVVLVTDDTDLSRVATAARRLDGRLQGMRVSGTVFLADLDDRHLVRVCGYKQCGERPPCSARTCGRRRYLFQDSFRLPAAEVSDPPVVVFPEVATRGNVPDDVTEELLARLPGGR